MRNKNVRNDSLKQAMDVLKKSEVKNLGLGIELKK
jgi:hypothetical protein